MFCILRDCSTYPTTLPCNPFSIMLNILVFHQPLVRYANEPNNTRTLMYHTYSFTPKFFPLLPQLPHPCHIHFIKMNMFLHIFCPKLSLLQQRSFPFSQGSIFFMFVPDFYKLSIFRPTTHSVTLRCTIGLSVFCLPASFFQFVYFG